MPLWEEIENRLPISSARGGWKPEEITRVFDEAGVAGGERLGKSSEGLPITLRTVGSGPRRVLLWSQMHGDEPTHTTALASLLGLLADRSGPLKRVTRGLTLGIVCPLNPDGALRATRRNAQGVDVNRDFTTFATAEAQALRAAFERFAPNYALNLHNQPHRRAMPDTPRRPASLSLQVPPIDAADTQTESVQTANRIAAILATLGGSRCGERVSRYPADWMPRASGDWAQSQGVPTVLIESGGWPANDFAALDRFHGALLGCLLDAIAATALGEPGGLSEYDPAHYLKLPRSSPRELCDLVLRPAGVAGGAGVSPLEVGVNFPRLSVYHPVARGGVIAGVGDLSEEGGIETLETDALLLPGRCALARESVPSRQQLATRGVTALLAPIDVASEASWGLAQLREALAPIAVEPVVVCGGDVDPSRLLRRLTQAVGEGAVATLGELPRLLMEACCGLGLPALDPVGTPRADDSAPDSVGAWVDQTARTADLLGWHDRGRIDFGTRADLALVAAAGKTLGPVERVYAGGLPVSAIQGP